MALKPLKSPETLIDIKAQFAGRLVAFTPVVREKIGLGIAEANSPGYTPLSLSRVRADTWGEMDAEADRLNREVFGLEPAAAQRIVASSMAASNRIRSAL